MASKKNTKKAKSSLESSDETENFSQATVITSIAEDNSRDSLNSQNLNSAVLESIFQNGKNCVFKEKKFIIGEKEKYYTPILNFYECTTQFEEKPLNKISFKCLICAEKILYSKLGRTTNLNRHLKDDHKKHSKLVDWLKKYDQFNSKNLRAKEKATIDDNMLDLIKYFISSNNSLTELKNKYFRRLMKKAKIKSPDYRTFVNGFLPELMKSLHEKILSKLTHAQSIGLITDIWTNDQLRDFIAVAASVIDDNFKKDVIIIGFARMIGNHCAENVKTGVENIVNSYQFDKSKISGK